MAGLPWRGHTDLLAHLTGSPFVAMMFESPALRVVLATVHIALRRRAARADVRPWSSARFASTAASCRDSASPRRAWRSPRSIRTPASTA